MSTNGSIYNQIKELEEKLLDPAFRKRPEKISALLADDFIEYGSSGSIFNKQEVINLLQEEIPWTIIIQNFQVVNIAPDVILATYLAERFNTDNIKLASSLRSSVWKFFDNRWQLIFHQGTPLPVEG